MKDRLRTALLFQLSQLDTMYPDLPDGGCYQLFLKIPDRLSIQVGDLGKLFFQPGGYIYTGSHQKNVIKRLIRHLKPHKKVFWHIDYLTSHPDVKFLGMVIYFGEQKECYINQRFRDLAGAQVPFPDFGSTDCKNGCGSHLLFLKSEGLLNLSAWGMLYIGGKSQSEYLLLCKSKPGLSVKILHRRDIPDARIT